MRDMGIDEEAAMAKIEVEVVAHSTHPMIRGLRPATVPLGIRYGAVPGSDIGPSTVNWFRSSSMTIRKTAGLLMIAFATLRPGPQISPTSQSHPVWSAYCAASFERSQISRDESFGATKLR
jgi:hypothetical protein